MMDEGSATAAFPATDDDEDAIVSVLASIERGEVEMAPGHLSPVAAYLAHPRKAVRRHAAGALSVAFARGQVEPSICEDLLTSDDRNVRWGAAFALGHAGHAGSRVIDVAMATLDADDGDVRWAAASIVVRTARASADLRSRLRALAGDGQARTRKMALLCLCDSGERDGGLYRGALADADPFVRLAALTSLARGGDRSEETLSAISAVADTDADARVRRGAVAILRRLGAA